MVDYWQEHGSRQISADGIRARLKLIRRFFDVEVTAGRLREPLLPARIDDRLMNRFRLWATEKDRIVTRSRDRKAGEWGKNTCVREKSTAEESINALKAALNHNRKRMPEVPEIMHRTRATVSAPRLYRLSVDQLAEMLDYTATGGSGRTAAHAVRLTPLRRYLIGALCTVARPDAIHDLSVLHERQQWDRNRQVFDLNPLGRIRRASIAPSFPSSGCCSYGWR
jgi:hypothetical protein